MTLSASSEKINKFMELEDYADRNLLFSEQYASIKSLINFVENPSSPRPQKPGEPPRSAKLSFYYRCHIYLPYGIKYFLDEKSNTFDRKALLFNRRYQPIGLWDSERRIDYSEFRSHESWLVDSDQLISIFPPRIVNSNAGRLGFSTRYASIDSKLLPGEYRDSQAWLYTDSRMNTKSASNYKEYREKLLVLDSAIGSSKFKYGGIKLSLTEF